MSIPVFSVSVTGFPDYQTLKESQFFMKRAKMNFKIFEVYGKDWGILLELEYMKSHPDVKS